MFRATPRAANAQVVTTTKQMVRQHAMLSLLVPIIGIKKYKPVILDIIVPVWMKIKRHAKQEDTLAILVQFFVLIVHRVHMLRSMPLPNVPSATTTNTNQNLKLWVVLKSKKGTTSRVQQQW
jgi:hypothetical protein